MRELHVVAVSEDGRHVVLGSRKGALARPEFKVAMDDRLKAAIRGDLPRLGELAAPESAVTPKDIQSRLRAGETVEQIAASAGVPAARVERFAGPVLSERERMIAGARTAVLSRARRGPSALSLGDAVAEHLQDMAGYKADTTTWTARREESGRWLVQVTFVARAKQRIAGWRYDPFTREVDAVDPWSAAIAHVDVPASRREARSTASPRSRTAPSVPARSIAPAPATVRASAPRPRAASARLVVRRPAAPVVAVRSATAAKKATPKAAPKTAVRAAVKTAVKTATPAAPKAAVRAAPQVVAPRSVAAKSPKPVVRKQAPATKVPVTRAPVTKRPATKAPVTRAPATKPPVAEPVEVSPAAALVTPAPAGPPTLRVVPSPEPSPVPPAPPAPAAPPASTDAEQAERDSAALPRPAARRAAGGRASVPVWADVLMGTVPSRPPAAPDAER